MKSRKKSPKIYHCKKCYYTCRNKYDFNKHLSTTKHKMLQNATKMLQENRQICPCGKAYKHRPSLTRHKKKCTYTVVKPMECEKAAHADEKKVLVILNTIMKDNQSILKENRELRKEIKNIKINNITNNNNQKYNINVFLNEHCKDAMCLEDFISNLHVTLQDVMKTAQDGFVGGVSNIISLNLIFGNSFFKCFLHSMGSVLREPMFNS